VAYRCREESLLLLSLLLLFGWASPPAACVMCARRPPPGSGRGGTADTPAGRDHQRHPEGGRWVYPDRYLAQFCFVYGTLEFRADNVNVCRCREESLLLLLLLLLLLSPVACFMCVHRRRPPHLRSRWYSRCAARRNGAMEPDETIRRAIGGGGCVTNAITDTQNNINKLNCVRLESDNIRCLMC